MKKISLFTLLTITSVVLFAQNTTTTTTGTARFGLKGGVNLATLELDDDTPSTEFNTNLKTSFNLGAFVNVPLGETLRFQPEVVYSGQGSKVSQKTTVGAGATTTTPFEYDFHYINVPMMLQIQTPGGFFVEAGPQIGFLLSAKQDMETGNDPDIQDLIKKTDVGAGAGLGYVSKMGLGIGARYTHGFSNVWNSDKAPAAQKNTEVSNRTISFSLLYQFGANK
mgnify:FL=1